MERSNFEYPDALEPSNSWSKSARVKFLHESRKLKWVEGQLEISNNNHLIFHEVYKYFNNFSNIMFQYNISNGIHLL